ncbi:hypothetical protein T03_11016 [Trichinella britovi]|uniref:Uncharacterized protein n=1 Tax=Trichinella britovi TaxID=45882 RepID=A0A0V0YYT2_TRIBR|nr:hypothetical protein T03_11016 [Trichinella britovi]
MSLRYSQGFWWMCSSSSPNDVTGQWNHLCAIPCAVATTVRFSAFENKFHHHFFDLKRGL